MWKRITALLLVFMLIIEIPVMNFYEGKAYAAALSIPLIVEGAEALYVIGGLAAGLGLYGAKKAGEAIGEAIRDWDEQTEEEQSQTVELVAADYRKFYQDILDRGLLDDEPEFKALTESLAGEGSISGERLDALLDAKDLEKDSCKTTGQNGDDNKKKKIDATGALLNMFGDIFSGVIDKLGEQLAEEEYVEPVFPDCPFPLGNGIYYIIFSLNSKFYVQRKVNESVPEYTIDLLVSSKVQNRITANLTDPLYVLNGTEWEETELTYSSNIYARWYTYPNIQLLYINVPYKFYDANGTSSYGTAILKPAIPYPGWDEPEDEPDFDTAELVSNYFTENYNYITYNNDINNYTTNNSNSFFTENHYLLSQDLDDIIRNVIVPASQTVINNYSMDTDIDQDYINTVVIPTIVNEINANLNNNTELNLKDLDITQVIDFKGTAGDGTWEDVTFFGLEKKFPFCLPFDLIRFLSILDAEPRAPCITIILPLSIIGMEDYTITFDFSMFDEVAEILRTMELLGSVIGLMFITKKIMS